MASGRGRRAAALTESGNARLQILLLDYEMAREDDRSVLNAQAGAVSVAVALIAGITALISQTCQFQRGNPQCVRVPDALLAAAPLAPLAVVAFLVVIGSTATIRSYYARAVEAELRAFSPDPLSALPPLRPASYIDFTIGLVSLRRGGLSFRLLMLVIFGSIVVIFGGLTLLIIMQMRPSYQLAMSFGYGTLALLLVTHTARASVLGRRLFMQLAADYIDRTSTSDNLPIIAASAEPSSERGILAYLLLPRPEELIKWPFFPIAAIVAFFSTSTVTWPAVGRAAVLFLILEYLLYEARYQLNDLRGFAEDGLHPDRRSRARLPHGPSFLQARKNASASLTVAVARIALAFVIAFALGDSLVEATSALFLLVVGTAVVYEWLRSSKRLDVSLRVPAIWIFVGAGYALRGTTGLVVGGIESIPTLTVAALAFGAFGVAFVTCTWLLEAVAHCHGSIPGHVWQMAGKGTEKPHLLNLLPYVGAKFSGTWGNVKPVSSPAPQETGAQPVHPLVLSPEPTASFPSSLRAFPALRARGIVNSPWNWAQLISVALGGVLGSALAAGGVIEVPFGLLSGVIGAAAGVLLMFSRTSLERVATVGAGTAALAGLGYILGSDSTLLAGAPFLVFAGFITWFRSQSYADLKLGLKPVLDATRAAGKRFLAAVLGPQTTDYLYSESVRLQSKEDRARD